jgi:hypothetical protein
MGTEEQSLLKKSANDGSAICQSGAYKFGKAKLI